MRSMRNSSLGVAATYSLWGVAAFGLPDNMGTEMVFQGYLTDSNSTPPGAYVNGFCKMSFKLCDALSGGTCSVPHTEPCVPVSKGIFVTPIGDFGAGAIDGTARWLEITMDCVTNPNQCPPPSVNPPLTPRLELRPEPHALALPGLWTQQTGPSNAPTAANLIGGYFDNVVSPGVIGATISGGGGPASQNQVNQVTDHFGTVGGGYDNQAGNNTPSLVDAQWATVGGGDGNSATGDSATVAGGALNLASGVYSSIGGGHSNIANAIRATVSGGQDNHATGTGSFVGGGMQSFATGDYSTIAGGNVNVAGGILASIGGGQSNDAGGDWATVPGGQSNTAQGNYSFAAGRQANAVFDGDFVWADSTGPPFTSTGPDQFLIRAEGGVGIGTDSPGHQLHVHDGAIWVTAPNGIPNWGGPMVLLGGGTVLDPNGIWGIEYDPNGGGFGGGLNFWKPFGNSTPFGNYFLFLKDTNGYVGIGTPNPQRSLEVNGRVRITNPSVNLPTGAPSNLMVTVDANGDLFTDTIPGTASNDWALLGNAAASGDFLGTTNNQDLRIRTNNQERMTVLSNGLVGIGTSTPSQYLEIGDNANIGSPFVKLNRNNLNQAAGVIFSTGGAAGGLDKWQIMLPSSEGNDNLWIKNSGSGPAPVMAFDRSNNNVGINKKNPMHTLDVNGTLAAILPAGFGCSVVWDSSTNCFYCDSSSRRYKENITTLEVDFERLLDARPVVYTRPGRPDQLEIGWIAEEIHDLGLTHLTEYDTEKRIEGVNYRKAVVYLTEIAKNQAKKIGCLEAENADIRTRVERLENLQQAAAPQPVLSSLSLPIVGFILLGSLIVRNHRSEGGAR